eukprot:Gregarina_sp_Poly_1__3706@NODE_2096_length_2691_cov_49_213796_g1352_i0_p1_GENE_NODE_2096_length_2691_cov_49_213796_g1352_i0NODE_2096_length_2691_cov_49_213796_g1352_i0_p1_ORF_typecomplete_len463_score49_65Mac/PF12464_8/5_3e02Mac/PF12464_8/3_1e03Mac/PF12464_8/0_41Herpes_UL14/PF03580_14/0_78Herpes_UL14/PF03580_14/52DUF4200/PF13863_6/1_9e02DUF4200/PF13863_6/4_1_NODE_2096_length_2691_cov_49_213796_g1352_i012882676
MAQSSWKEDAVERYIICKKEADNPWGDLYNEVNDKEVNEVRQLLHSICVVLDKQRARSKSRAIASQQRKATVVESNDTNENNPPSGLKRVASVASPGSSSQPRKKGKHETRIKRVLDDQSAQDRGPEYARHSLKKRRICSSSCVVSRHPGINIIRQPFYRGKQTCHLVNVVSITPVCSISPDRRCLYLSPIAIMCGLNRFVEFCMEYLGHGEYIHSSDFCEIEMTKVSPATHSVILSVFRATCFQMGLYLNRYGSVDYFTAQVSEFVATFQQVANETAHAGEIASSQSQAKELQSKLLQSNDPVEDSKEIFLKILSLYRRYLSEAANRLRSLVGLIENARSGVVTDFVGACKVVLKMQGENPGAKDIQNGAAWLLDDRVNLTGNSEHSQLLRKHELLTVYTSFGFPPLDLELEVLRTECKQYMTRFVNQLFETEQAEQQLQEELLRQKQVRVCYVVVVGNVQ